MYRYALAERIEIGWLSSLLPKPVVQGKRVVRNPVHPVDIVLTLQFGNIVPETNLDVENGVMSCMSDLHILPP